MIIEMSEKLREKRQRLSTDSHCSIYTESHEKECFQEGFNFCFQEMAPLIVLVQRARDILYNTVELNDKTINRLNFYSKLRGISQGEAIELLVREARIRGNLGISGLLFGAGSCLFSTIIMHGHPRSS